MTLDGGMVAAGNGPRQGGGSPRGPVGGGAENQWRKQLASVLDPELLDQLRSRLLERDQQVRRHRRGGVVRGGGLLGDLERPHAERFRQRAGVGQAGLVGPGDRGGSATDRRLTVAAAPKRVGVAARGAT